MRNGGKHINLENDAIKTVVYFEVRIVIVVWHIDTIKMLKIKIKKIKKKEEEEE